MTVNVWPPAVMVAALDDVVLFDATLNVTVPLPLPDEPLLTVSHPPALTAVQAHPLATETFTEPPDAVAGSEALDAESDGVHTGE